MLDWNILLLLRIKDGKDSLNTGEYV